MLITCLSIWTCFTQELIIKDLTRPELLEISALIPGHSANLLIFQPYFSPNKKFDFYQHVHV